MSLAEPPPRTSASLRRCAFIAGLSLHADASVSAADRPALERLGRFATALVALTDSASFCCERQLDRERDVDRGGTSESIAMELLEVGRQA